MMKITAIEFETNFDKYLNLASEEEICITKNGVDIALLIPHKSQISVIDDLIGVIPNNGYTTKQARADRRVGTLKTKCN